MLLQLHRRWPFGDSFLTGFHSGQRSFPCSHDLHGQVLSNHQTGLFLRRCFNPVPRASRDSVHLKGLGVHNHHRHHSFLPRRVSSRRLPKKVKILLFKGVTLFQTSSKSRAILKCPLQMIIFHSNESFLLIFYKKEGQQRECGCKIICRPFSFECNALI